MRRDSVLYFGTVKSTKDPKKLNRVQVELKELAKAVEMPWIRTLSAHASKGFGTTLLPEVGDIVAVLRGAGESVSSMLVIGSVYDSKNKPAIGDKDGKTTSNSSSLAASTTSQSAMKRARERSLLSLLKSQKWSLMTRPVRFISK